MAGVDFCLLMSIEEGVKPLGYEIETWILVEEVFNVKYEGDRYKH